MPLPPDVLHRALAQAAELALRGRFRTEPNPLVGAVVLDAEGVVRGRGWHARWGGPHAEVAAIADAGDAARGGTLVVTLEPCAHDGNGKKTPPCVAAVREAGIVRVVAGGPDPNPATSGRAAAEFAAAGIAYEERTDVRADLRAALDGLLAVHARSVRGELPWVVAKWAMSLDGRIADSGGHSRWITAAPARDVVHEIRATVDAVAVGRGTVDRDDPLLTCRLPGREATPLRVVLDTHLKVSPETRVVATAREVRTLLVCADGADADRRRALEARGAEVLEVPAGPSGRVKLGAAFRELRRRGVRRMLLEAGPVLTGACFRAGLVRQVAAFTAPVVIGGTGPGPFEGGGWALADAPRLEEVRAGVVGTDTLIEGYWPVSRADA